VNNLTEQNAGTAPLDSSTLPGLTPLSQITLVASPGLDGQNRVLSWPAGIGPAILECSSNFQDWSPMDPQPAGNRYSAPITGERGFFRLVKP
jgi:hypothetical protein